MKPIVYIDMLFLLNLFMDTATIYSASLIIKRRISNLRLFLASSILAIYSCAMFFPMLKLFYTILGKLAILTFASFVAFPSKNFFSILKNAFVFFAVSGIFGGIIFALIFLTDFGTTVGAAVSNGEVYLDIKASTLLFSVAISYVAIYTISYIKNRTLNLGKLIHDAEIILFDHKLKISIFADSGCLLSDPIKNRPAIILSQKASKKLVPTQILKELSSSLPDINQFGGYSQRYCALPFSTIDKKSGILHGFVPDSVMIDQKVTKACVIAISDKALNLAFDGIFNPILLAQDNELNIKTTEGRF